MRDGQGLLLRQRTSGAYWLLRCRHKHRTQEMAVGKWPETNLAEAREIAGAMRKRIKSGLPAREQERDPCPIFSDLATETWEALQPGWQSGKHVAQWIKTVRDYANPRIGKMPVDQIQSVDVLAVLQPIWFEKAETAKRLKQRLEVIFERGLAKGHIDISPMPKVAAALGKQRTQKTHFKSLHYSELASALEQVDQSGASQSLKCLVRFSALTGVRPGEARKTTWEEIDFEEGLWTIPAKRKKERRDFVVPLSSQALAVLKLCQAFERGSGSLVFPGQTSMKPFSENAVCLAFKRCGIDTTAHGLRSTLRVWAQENGVSWEIGEALLAHKVGSETAQAYARSDQLKQRREVLERWGQYLDGENGEVVRLYG